MTDTRDELTPFERALVLTVLEQDGAPVPRKPLNVDAVRAVGRSMSGCGVITDLCESDVCRIYDEGTSLRLGAHTIARLNGHEDVCLVVYVDDGKITALEACTFGGRPWPDEIREFVFEGV